MMEKIISTLKHNRHVVLVGLLGRLIASVAIIIVALQWIISGELVVGNTRIPLPFIGKEEAPALNAPNTEVARAPERTVPEVVSMVNPAVVSIIAKKDVPVMEQYYANPFGGEQFSPFGFFNFQIPQYRQKGTEEKEVGSGSGFFVTGEGLIVTNRHVVSDKDATYTIFTNSGETYDAEVVARDPILDIAFLKVKKSGNFPFLSFGESASLQLGETVIAIGNALGEFRNSVSVGVVSGLSRSIVARDGRGGAESLDEVIQTDAAINPGNSGGPLLNTRGEVIGVNVAVAQGSQSVGFSIPSDVVKAVTLSVKETGKIVRPYIGVRYLHITKQVQEKNGLSVDYGVLVQRGATAADLAVIPGSPAHKAGVVENDIILEIDGVKITEKKSFASVIRTKTVGQTVTLKLLRAKEEKEIQVTLEALPDKF